MYKHPSGAQKRKADKAERKRQGGIKAEWVEAAEALGAPPTDPVRRVAWASELCAQFLFEVATHKKIDAKDRWKLGAEFVRTIGMTAVKALYEERLKKLEQHVYGKRRRGKSDAREDGLETIE